MEKSLEIFLSSAPEDDVLRDELEKQLRNWERQGLITLWHAHRLTAGTEWEREIETHLSTAQLILLLISPDFMESDQCDRQMKRALERHAAEEAHVIPILLRPVYWQDAPFRILRVLPSNANPVTSWPDRDEALLDIVTALRNVIDGMISLPSVVSTSTDEHPLVFLSHSRTDDAFATHLKVDLQAQGITSWIERRDIRPGNVGREEALRTAIRRSRAILLVVSPATRNSRTVKEELHIAEMYQRPVYPVWIAGNAWREVVPLSLAGTQYIDGREERYLQAVHSCVSKLTRDQAVSQTQRSVSQRPALTTDPPRNPYKGLQAFRREDARDFFGRSQLIEELVEAVGRVLPPESQQDTVTSPRLVTVVGASGSGKSSVVMAGLLPLLQQGRLPGSQEWLYLEPMVPGPRPLEALALILSKHFPARSLTSIREDLEDDTSRGLHLLMASLLKQANAHCVLIVDQFEEVFTQTESEEERRRFLDLLITVCTEPQGSGIVLLTLRADFSDRPLRYPELARLLEAHRVVVLPMEMGDLREVIEKPAHLPDVQLTFEQDLVGDLLFEVQGQPGALPLLQFTLDQLYQKRNGRLLTRQAYRDIGGVKGALAKHAEGIYLSLPEDHRQLARALFVRLIDPGTVEQDTTRRRAMLSEFSLPDPTQTRLLRETMDAFIAARLLMINEKGGITTVEVSHEALIREWPRPAQWMREGREDIPLQQTISKDVAAWERLGKPKDRLYRGSQLKEASMWAKRNLPSKQEILFLHSSTVHQQRQIAKLIGIVLLSVIVAGLGVQLLLLIRPPWCPAFLCLPPQPVLQKQGVHDSDLEVVFRTLQSSSYMLPDDPSHYTSNNLPTNVSVQQIDTDKLPPYRVVVGVHSLQQGRFGIIIEQVTLIIKQVQHVIPYPLHVWIKDNRRDFHSNPYRVIYSGEDVGTSLPAVYVQQPLEHVQLVAGEADELDIQVLSRVVADIHFQVQITYRVANESQQHILALPDVLEVMFSDTSNWHPYRLQNGHLVPIS